MAGLDVSHGGGVDTELFGPGGLLGNHIVIDLGDGTYAALAHLKRRSITVAEGQQVNPGQELAACRELRQFQ